MANNTNAYRFRSSSRNAMAAVVTSIVMGVISFVERVVFNQCFISDYLGFYSLFKNVISVLSVANLGLSSAIAFSLYAPLAEDDYDEVRAILFFFKKVYLVVGTVILLLGLAFTPFLKFFVSTEVEMSAVQTYFIIFLLSTVFEYYLSYKYILFNADQKQYVTTIVTNLGWASMYFVQIIVSITTHSFLLYSICLFVFDSLQGVITNVLADRKYKYLKSKKPGKLSEKSKDGIVQNVKGLIWSKFGNVLVSSSDSIMISAIVGSSILGLYSNYQMISKGLLTFTKILPNAITASIGNVGAVESNETVSESYKYIDMSFFLLYGIISVVLFNIINPIVATFFGASRTLPISSALCICVLFYLENSKSLFSTYRSSLGLFWFDRYRPIISGIMNIIVSILLGNVIGFDGIILGTIITYVVIDLWFEPMVIYHKGFHQSSRKYILFSFSRLLLIISLMLITNYFTSFFPSRGLLSIIARTIVSLAISAAVLLMFFCKNKYVKQSVSALKKYILRKDGMI